MSAPPDPTIPGSPTGSAARPPELARALEALRDYVNGPEVDDPRVAQRRDLHLLDRLTTELMPAAALRASERDALGYLIGDRRDDFVQWLREVSVPEAWSLANDLENDDPPLADISTRLAVIDTVRRDRFQSIAEALNRYTYLHAAIKQRSRLRSDGAPPGSGRLLTHTYEAFTTELNRGGLSASERRHAQELRHEDGHHDRTQIPLRDTDLAEVTKSSATAPEPDQTGVGAALAARVDELPVWQRLIAGESDTPYFASFRDNRGTSRTAYHPSESVACTWLLGSSWETAPDAVVESAIYRPDPATGAQRLCWQTQPMPVAEHIAQLETLNSLWPTARRTRDDYTDTKQLSALRTEYMIATQQLNDPGMAASAFETAIHRDNLRTTLSKFAASIGRADQTEWAIKHIDRATRPVRLVDLGRRYTPYLDAAIQRAEQHLTDLQFNGVSVNITDVPGTALHNAQIGWSHTEGPDRWFHSITDFDSDTLFTEEKFPTLTALLDAHPEHQHHPAAADILLDFDNDHRQAQSGADIARAWRDTIRHSTPMPDGLAPDGLLLRRRDPTGKTVSTLTVGSGREQTRAAASDSHPHASSEPAAQSGVRTASAPSPPKATTVAARPEPRAAAPRRPIPGVASAAANRRKPRL
ncbi:hypothetical protein ACFWPH_28220 [Nocardia sp. NPDC058499]|uniref:hypothetical protein n=1 Tax=Nocardia sp. NPDC058499 TaxID=3346530 RepID=UPI0036690E43